MKRLLFPLACLAILNGCGGGSQADNAVLPTPVVPPPVDGVADPIYPPNLSKTSCSGLDFLQLISVDSDANSSNEFAASKAIDGNFYGHGENPSFVKTGLSGFEHWIRRSSTPTFGLIRRLA